MEEHVSVSDDDTKTLRVMVLDPVGLALPLGQVDGRMRRRDNLALATDFGRGELEEIIADGDDLGLAEERPTDENTFSDDGLGDVLGRLALMLVLNIYDDRGVLRVRVMDIDLVVTEVRRMRERLERGEAGESGRAEVDAREKASDE